MASRLIAYTLALFCGIAIPAFAGPAVTITSLGPTVTGNGTYGFAFTAKTIQTIQALGVYDNGNDGLAGPAMVGLWVIDPNGNETLLAEADVPAGTGGKLIDAFRYVAIAPVTLDTNPLVTYLVASYQPSDPITSFNTGTGGTATLDPYIAAIYDYEAADSNGLIFPNVSQGRQGGFLGANFTTDAIAAPEPASLVVLGSGLAGLTSLRRRTAKR
jgi:PEP-CTERM motif-containing protein